MGREAWLAAITAAFGLAEGCHHDTETNPAAAREVPSASTVVSLAAATPSSSAPTVASEEPSAAASVSASASASAAPSATTAVTAAEYGLRQQIGTSGICGGSANPNPTGIGSGIGRMRSLANLSCGAPARRDTPTTTASISTSLSGGSADDERTVAQLHGRLRMCANHALEQDPNESGTLRLLIHVAASGEVSAVDATSGSSLSAQSVACMTNMIRHGQFSSSSAPRQLVLTIRQSRSS